MFDIKQKKWVSQDTDEVMLQWCREPFNRDNPEAAYMLADHLLEDLSEGDVVADAVYKMETAADQDWPDAAYAMGQMFEYGWAVGRNKKTARSWYEKAAALGHEEAAKTLERMRRERRRRILMACAGVAAACIIAAAALGVFSGVSGILVGRDTELQETTTIEEFTEALVELIEEHDDTLVVTGQRRSNRLILKFEGDTLDLRKFPAAKVIASKDNVVIIQFETEEDADACLRALQENESIVFVQEDEYSEYDLEGYSGRSPGLEAVPDNSGLNKETTGPERHGTEAEESQGKKEDPGPDAAVDPEDRIRPSSVYSAGQETQSTIRSQVDEESGETLYYSDAEYIPEYTDGPYAYTSPYTGESYYSWGVSYMGFDVLADWLKDKPTQPVVVAVMDTGVVPCEETQDRILEGFSIQAGGKGQDPERDFENGFGNSHGTHVAGTILDCTRGLDISVLPVRCFLTEAEGQYYNAITTNYLCLKYIKESGADVVNMSLGGFYNPTPALDSIIEEVVSGGIIVITSSGNYNDPDSPHPVYTGDCTEHWPQYHDECIVVGALDKDGTIASFSDHGETLDVCAPGVGIMSNIPEGWYLEPYDADGNGSYDDNGDGIVDDPLRFPNIRQREMTGTSMASPHIAALAAILKLYHKDRTPAQIEQYIKDYCMAVGNADPEFYGAGLPIAARFVDGENDWEMQPPEDRDTSPIEEEIRERREENGGRTGAITFTLIWDSEDDLDLHCTTPNANVIYYNNRTADGGRLDIDANAGTPYMEHPVENIYFEQPGNGVYSVWAHNYSDRTPGESTTATLQVQIGEDVEIYQFELTDKGDETEHIRVEYNGGE